MAMVATLAAVEEDGGPQRRRLLQGSASAVVASATHARQWLGRRCIWRRGEDRRGSGCEEALYIRVW